MKPLLLTSALLFSAVLYSQDSVTTYTDSVGEKTDYYLNEIVISNMADEVSLGEPDEKSKKMQVITSDSKTAYYFENTVGEGTYLKALMFKVGKVRHNTKARIRLYEKKSYIQEVNMKEGVKKYQSFIPGEEISSEEIEVNLKPGQKGLIEIDLLEYGITMPVEGLFVSIEGVGYYDAEGNSIANVKTKELTWLEFHVTTSDNFCGWINPQGTDNGFWVNINKWRKSDFEFLGTKTPKKALIAPNFGLKVVRR